MSDVGVARLRLRSPPGRSMTACARAEDALRLAASDDGRLLLLRRLDLGRMMSGARSTQWEARVSAKLGEQRSRAVHASAAGAASAEAVWFRSFEEALILLLIELAAGRTPEAWFWDLALPEWRGESLGRLLSGLLRKAAGNPPLEVTLARAMVAIANAGWLAKFLAALQFASPPKGSAMNMRRIPDIKSVAAIRAWELMRRHNNALETLLINAMNDVAAESGVRRWLARLSLVSVAPELAGQSRLLTEMEDALFAPAVAESPNHDRDMAIGDDLRVHTAPRGRRFAAELARERRQRTGPASASQAQRPARTGKADGRQSYAKRGHAGSPSAESFRPPDIKSVELQSPPNGIALERESAGAGLFLLIRPLWLMGLEDWLDRYPELAIRGFGKGLLRHIAQRMRVADDDPLFAVLDTDAFDDATEIFDAWRIGLDRWLRKRVKRRLAEIVGRRGWLDRDDERLSIRYPIEDADLALRRRLLDSDPGWVPWLGLVVRFHFRDGPIA